MSQRIAEAPQKRKTNVKFEILEQYKDLTELMQGAPLFYQISDIYGELGATKRLRGKWLETCDEADWNYVLSEVDFAKSLTAMSLNDPKINAKDKSVLKEAVTTIIDLLLDPHTEDAELEHWFSLLMRWYSDPRTGKLGHRLKIPHEMRK